MYVHSYYDILLVSISNGKQSGGGDGVVSSCVCCIFYDVVLISTH